MEIGIKGHIERTVEGFMTAESMRSGNLPVFATPYLAALMEQACAESVRPFLLEGETTVGTALDIRHLAATPEGMEIFCDTTLVEIDRRRLVFETEVRDEIEVVGTSRHERFIVNCAKFMEKASGKLKR